MRPSLSLPPRIWIVGPCGSGKSTLGARLGARLGVPYTAIDDLHWLPGWVERPRPETRALLEAAVAEDAWVVDGNYTALREPLMHEADLIVWLDLRLRVTLPRLLRRCFTRAILGRTCCNGNHESIWRTLFTRDSILLWAWTTDRRRREGLSRDLSALPHVRLREPRDVDRWMRRHGVARATEGS